MGPKKPPEQRVLRGVGLVLTAVLPCTLVALFNGSFILNQFYDRAPYLLDEGWLSSLVHRSGATLQNPGATRHYGETFYCVHVSPFMSLFSLLSYVFPLDRIAWYALFQGVVYAPLGLTAYFVSSRTEPVPFWRLPLTALTALALAFSGQSIMAINYPHFEPAISGFVCLLLACIVTGRRTSIWPLLVLAISVREDAGFHTALSLAPLLRVRWAGKEDPALRRMLFELIGVAFGWSVVAFTAQKVFFPAPASAWQMAFFGKPLFHHLGAHALGERLLWLVSGCPHITVPFVATVIVAAVRRDARYLLGWLVAVPWLVANLLAYEDAKWRLSAYVGFPFLVSVFWVYLYGALLAPPARRLPRTSLELVFASMGLASTAALYIQYPSLVQSVVRGALRMDQARPEEVRAYAKAINERGAALGRLSVDGPVLALTMESIVRDDGYRPGRRETETFAFHRDGSPGAELLLDLAANGISRCTHVLETAYFLCSRREGAEALLAAAVTERVPPLLVFASFDANGRRIGFEPGGVVIAAGSAPGLVIANRPMAMPATGNFEVVWDLASDVAIGASDSAPVATVDVVLDGITVVRKEAPSSGRREQRIVLPFAARKGQGFGSRLWYQGPATLVIEGADLRTAPPR